MEPFLDFILEKKWKIISTILFVVVFVLFLVLSNDSMVRIVLPKADGTGYFFEYRLIAKQHGLNNKIRRIVEEVMLGSSEELYRNPYAETARYISSFIVDDTLYLNLNIDTVNQYREAIPGSDNTSLALLKGLVNSVCLNVPSIKRVKFLFDGISSDYIGVDGPFKDGIEPDYSI